MEAIYTGPMTTPDESDREDDECDDDDDEPLIETTCECRCGECCRRLLIEVDLADAAREPKIAVLASPTYLPGELTKSGERELIGYLLNSSTNDMACIFLDQTTNACTIYETRPTGCRAFDCDGEGREQLIELGILGRVKG